MMITTMPLFGSFMAMTILAFGVIMPTHVEASWKTVYGTTSQEANQPILNLESIATSSSNQSDVSPSIPAVDESQNLALDSANTTTYQTLEQRMSNYEDRRNKTKSQRVGSSFEVGIGFPGLSYLDNYNLNNAGSIPPDPTCAASSTTLVGAVNNAIEVRTKFGGVLFKVGFSTFFTNLGSIGSLFDPKTIYDEYEDRFFIVVMQRVDPGSASLAGTASYTTGVSRILLAVSQSGSPTAKSDFYVTSIDSLEYSSSLGDYVWADYPGLAISPEAVYITANLYSFQKRKGYANRVWILDKNNFYSGGQSNYRKEDPYGGKYFLSTAPAGVYGGAIGNNIGTYLVAYSGFTYNDGTNQVVVTIVTNPTGTATFTRHLLDLGVIDDTSTALPDAPQLDSSDAIAVGDRRVLDVVWHSNRLWLTTTILPYSGPNADQTTAYWVKIDTDTLTVEDQGEIGGEDIAAGTFTSFASVAVNSDGVAAFGFAAYGPSIYAGAYVVGRIPTDPPGTVSSSFVVGEGIDSYYRTFSGTKNRWGDYSGIAVDPLDGTFWVYNEYADARNYLDSRGQDGVWATAWVNFFSTNQPSPPPSPSPTRKPTASAPTVTIKIPPGYCFSAANTVNVNGKGEVPINDLKIGDKVKDANGDMVPVYSFGHYHPNVVSEYLQIHVKGLDKPLEISKDHLLFVNGTAVPASFVSPGDYVDLADAAGTQPKVQKITSKVGIGAYAPFTTSGTIVVSGVAASSYVTLQTNSTVLWLGRFQTSLTVQWLEHVFQAPHRLFCYLMGMNYCRKTETYNHDGISNWAAGPYHLFRRLMERNNGIFAGAVVIPASIVGLVFYALDVGWMYVVALIGALYVWHHRSLQKKV